MKRTKADWLACEVQYLPNLSNRTKKATHCLTLKEFLALAQDRADRSYGFCSERLPNLRGLGLDGLIEIRSALFKVGFTVKDSIFLRYHTREHQLEALRKRHSLSKGETEKILTIAHKEGWFRRPLF